MWNIVKHLIPVIIPVLLTGCPLASFEYLEISCSVPEGGNYYFSETVRLEFSIMPDRGETERNLILHEGGLSRTPIFTWDGRTLFIKPLTGWQKGEYYSINLEGQLRMEDGRSYTARMLRVFIYGQEGNEFTLVSSAMENNCLTFNFSKAPRITSFNEHFLLSPSTEYFCDFLGKTVRIQPKKPWQINTLYTWTIKDMESEDNYLMKKEYSGLFSGLEDITVPYPIELCPVSVYTAPYLWKTGTALDNRLENGEGIGFIFSKPMNMASLRSGISFYPSLKGHFEEAEINSIIFIPEENYRLETEYRVTLAPSIKDSLGLSLFEEIRYYFTSSHHYLTVEKVSFDSAAESLVPGGIPQDYSLVTVLPLPGIRINIAFSHVIPPAYRKAASDAVSLSVLFPASAHNPALISAQWFDNGALLSLCFEDISPSAGGIDNYYQIKISSGNQGPLNGSGEYLKEDLWFVFRVY
jgi:hypothetical protein